MPKKRHQNPIPIMMTVEKGGRLAPASAFDQERLDEYRIGSQLQLYFWQGRDFKRLRRYWAILHLVVKHSLTHHRDVTRLDRDLKMELGVTELVVPFNGKPYLVAGSISEDAMDDAEFNLYFRDAMDFLYQETGVDPLTLQKEAADTGMIAEENDDHDPETGEITESLPVDGAAPTSSQEEAPSQEPAEETPPRSAGSTPPLTLQVMLIEFARKCIAVLRNTRVPKPQDKWELIVDMERLYRVEADEADWQKLSGIRLAAEKANVGKWTVDEAVTWMIDKLGCTREELS